MAKGEELMWIWKRELLMLASIIERGIRPYQAVIGSCFYFSDHSEEIQRDSDDWKPWKMREETKNFAKKRLKNCGEVNFNPSLKSTLYSHLSKFPSQHYRGHLERKALQVAEKERHIFWRIFRIRELKLVCLLWIKFWSCSSIVGRDEAVNFLVTGTLPLFNGKNEDFKPKNNVPTVNQGGGFDVFGLFFA